MCKPTVSSYNSMTAAYLKQGQLEESLGFINKLVLSGEKPDGFTFAMILKISTTSNVIFCGVGKQVHSQILKSIVESDNILFAALVDSYAKNGKADYARKVYDRMFVRDVVCSTTMISGYMKEGSVEKAEEIFVRIVGKDTVVYNAMIDGYGKSIETAKRSVDVYIDMQRFGYRPTISTFMSLISACSMLAAYELGQQVQTRLMKSKFFTDVKLGSALVDMYSKCGRTEDARRIFDSMLDKNVFSWSSMIDGYGKNGNSNEALNLFNKMLREDKVKPNYVTFLSALSACVHAGLVCEGRKIFQSMERDHFLKPKMEHYACMVDLLGRSGSLREALEFINEMPEKPGYDVWGALLGACRLHGEVEMADIAANEIFKLSSHRNSGAYLALSNTFAAAGRWEGVSGVRELMKERGVSKDTGSTWIGTDKGLSGFHVGPKF
ncbi:hypothetical protein GIB67_023715 [Kingdonia uniflora]|uniref:Pentatricopeptide repeat-containing protein n=1 Tax=Kingdonia uniflora TaxID=39325 RepID=A0A7J7MGT6_9MAGN|nr:hypothetical protein GIB67_023715 [Kingdonia uniflora]